MATAAAAAALRVLAAALLIAALARAEASAGPSLEQQQPLIIQAKSAREILRRLQDKQPIDCKHGTLSADGQHCICDPGWATAGITDTLDFMEGVCEQFRCESDAQCRRRLQIPGASCPVPGWNCYCGIFTPWPWYNLGHGYETSGSEKEGAAECMGIMYAFSVGASEYLWYYIENAWMWFGVLAILCLPFGRKRSMCDHQWPSLWNSLRTCSGYQHACRGECVLSADYTVDTLKDDLAWTIYVLDVGIWTYIFLLTLYATTMFIWSVVLWAIVVIVCICLAVMGLCMLCCEGGGAGCDLGCPSVCECAGADCGDCFGLMALSHSYAHAATSSSDAFYHSGTFPYDPLWGYSGYGNLGSTGEEDSSCCCCFPRRSVMCRPLAWLVYVFPVVPENAWGGLIGRFCFGTHHFTPLGRSYQGGNRAIEFFRMGWRRRADLHGNDSWRRQVYSFLVDEVGDVAPDLLSTRLFTVPLEEENVVDGQRVVTVGRARAICIERPFNREDGIVDTSWTDYAKNECWICRSEGLEWDMWMSCHHMFCGDCSGEMLRRRMPCPLCRVSSSSVLRGEAYRGNVSSSSSDW